MNLEEHQKAGTHYAVSSRLLVGVLATLVLGGCGSTGSGWLPPPSRIDAEDNRVFLPALRAGINFGDFKQAASEPRTGHAVELGIANARGSDFQNLAVGQGPVNISNTSFTAPQQIKNDFNLYFVHLSWRWRKFFRERSLGLEVLAGAGHTSLGLTVSSPTQRASGSFESSGPQAGVGLIWRMSPSTSIQARVAGFTTGGVYVRCAPGRKRNGVGRDFLCKGLRQESHTTSGLCWLENGRRWPCWHV